MNGPSKLFCKTPHIPKCKQLTKLPSNGVPLNCWFPNRNDGDVMDPRYSIRGQELPAFGHRHHEAISEAHSRSSSISCGDAAPLKMRPQLLHRNTRTAAHR